MASRPQTRSLIALAIVAAAAVSMIAAAVAGPPSDEPGSSSLQISAIGAVKKSYPETMDEPCFSSETGSLDPSFGTNGKVTTQVVPRWDEARSVAIQSDGKIVAAGHAYFDDLTAADFAIVRYNPDGSLDTSFGSSGVVVTPILSEADKAYSVAIQPDGKIVVAGFASTRGSGSSFIFYFAVVRYNIDGTLDTIFGVDGKVTTSVLGAIDIARSVAIQPDGKIILAGETSTGGSVFDIAVVRYNPDGSLDTTFGVGGKVTTFLSGHNDNDHAESVVVQPDGRIVVAGRSEVGPNYDFAVVRYNSDGSLDTTFDSDGKVTTPIRSGGDWAYGVKIQPDGKIVVAGNASDGSADFAVVRYNQDGSLDLTFDGDGKVTTPVFVGSDGAQSVAIQPDGKIVLAGFANGIYDFALVRYNPNGSLDPTFDGDGIITTSFLSSHDFAFSMAIQPDGKIVAVGYTVTGNNTGFALARYGAPCGSPTPTPTSTSTPTPTPVATPEFESDVAPRPNGDGIVVATDVTQIRRFATGLDTPVGSEGQRADCAPRQSLGDGIINAGDVIQARRYATGLDPLTATEGSGMLPSGKRRVFKVDSVATHFSDGSHFIWP